MKLEVYGLKFETTYNNRTYIIEAVDYFESDETKWLVTLDGKQLTKDYLFVHEANKYNDIIYNTKDEAVDALKTYLIIQDKVSVKENELKEEIVRLNRLVNFTPLYCPQTANITYKEYKFVSINEIRDLLISKKIDSVISLGNCNTSGVQVTVKYISDMFKLKKALEEIEVEYKYKLVNYFNFSCEHVSYSGPLYYYWKSFNGYTRWFTFVK